MVRWNRSICGISLSTDWINAPCYLLPPWGAGQARRTLRQLCSCIYIITWLPFKALCIMRPALLPPPRSTRTSAASPVLLFPPPEIKCLIVQLSSQTYVMFHCFTEPSNKQKQSSPCSVCSYVGGVCDKNSLCHTHTHADQPTHAHIEYYEWCVGRRSCLFVSVVHPPPPPHIPA